jgi:hypothetical protein
VGLKVDSGRRLYKRILTWDFDRIITGHAGLVLTGAKEAFRTGYGYLAEEKAVGEGTGAS